MPDGDSNGQVVSPARALQKQKKFEMDLLMHLVLLVRGAL